LFKFYSLFNIGLDNPHDSQADAVDEGIRQDGETAVHQVFVQSLYGQSDELFVEHSVLTDAKGG
jgi:hypothetical protein